MTYKDPIPTLNINGITHGSSSHLVTRIRKIATHRTSIKHLRNDRIGGIKRSDGSYFWLPWIACQLKETLFLSLYWKSSSYTVYQLNLTRLRIQVPHCGRAYICRKVFPHFQSMQHSATHWRRLNHHRCQYCQSYISPDLHYWHSGNQRKICLLWRPHIVFIQISRFHLLLFLR